MTRRIQLCLAFLFTVVLSSAQYTQVGVGAFKSSGYGPIFTPDSASYSRYAYIYPSASISSLQHGDTIRGIEFIRNGTDSLLGPANFKIYVKNTARFHFGAGSINWLAESRDSGMTLVYNDSPIDAVGNKPGNVRFDFNEVDYYVFDTTGNAVNFQVLVEYSQQTTQPSILTWYVETALSIPAFTSTNETKYVRGGTSTWMDSITDRTTSIKPTIRFNRPYYKKELDVRNVYALGRYPLRMKTADTVKVIVENVGLETLTNHEVYMEVTGVNSYKDTLTISSLAPYADTLIRFANYLPSNQGSETLTITGSADGDSTNNQSNITRLVNYNVFTHVDPNQPNAGGIGFAGSTGDFVAKFHVNDSDYINQIKVDFSQTNRLFQVGIWEDDGLNGLPGTNIFTSDTLLSTAGTYILGINPKVKIKDVFYVGIRQASNTNVGFSFQWETPVRPDVFYFAAPMGDSTWVPFSPDFSFNFNIQPRIQVSNDLAITEIIVPPNDTDYLYSTTDSITPRVKVNNYGSLDQNNFKVKLEILNRFNQVMYTDEQWIGLDADSSTYLDFKNFSLFNLGDFTARAEVDLNIDSVKDNNVLESNFILFKDHDVAADLIFEPSDGDSFNMNEQGFWPQVRIYNYGRIDQNNFKVAVRLRQGDSVLHLERRIHSLQGEQSLIITFDSVYPPAEGWMIFEAYTELDIDSFPINDTSRVMVYGKKLHDIGILSMIRPKENVKYATSTKFKPFLEYRNMGLENQDSIEIYCEIFNSSDSSVYRDTILNSLAFHSTTQALFKDFQTGATPANYKCVMEVKIENDQEEANDTLSRWFQVVDGRDLIVLAIDTPVQGEVLAVNTTPRPVYFSIYNNGLVQANNAKFLIQAIQEDQTIFWQDSFVDVVVPIGDTLHLVSQDLPFNKGGNYTLKVKNLWPAEDLFSSNDSLSITYVVKYQNDISLDWISNPNSGEELDLNSFDVPSVQLTNRGLSTKQGSVVVLVEDELKTELYRDTASFLNLLSTSDTVLNFKALLSNQEGSFHIKAYHLEGDEVANNDSLNHNYTVVRTFDVQMDSAELPSEGEALLIKYTHQPIAWISSKGKYDITDSVQLECRVFVESSMIYSQMEELSLDSGAVVQVFMDSSLRYPDNQTSRAVFTVSHTKDVDHSNDTLRVNFIFSDKLNISYKEVFGLSVYPNPFEKYVLIESLSPIESIELYDELGHQLFVDKPNTLQYRLEETLKTGIYFIRIYRSDGMHQLKVIKL
ncbi:MAG: T9SS type A sorting domain-containing protein [Bacteroidia bacterium]